MHCGIFVPKNRTKVAFGQKDIAIPVQKLLLYKIRWETMPWHFFPPSSLCSLFLLFHRGNSNASSKVNRVCPHAPSRGGHVQTANYHRLDCHQPTAKVKRTVTHPGYKLPSIVIDHQISPSLWLSNTPNDARILASVREHLVWIYVRFTLQRQIVTFFLTIYVKICKILFPIWYIYTLIKLIERSSFKICWMSSSSKKYERWKIKSIFTPFDLNFTHVPCRLFSRTFSWHWIVRFHKKKNIYIYFSVSSERSRGWGDREVRWRKRERKRGSRRQLGIFRRWQRLRSHPFPPSPSFRPRYFPALFLIYEPSGDSSFRSLINEGPDWIRDCNSGKFSGREITPHPRPVCTNKETQGSVVPLSHSNAMIKKS